ncbi:MAG: hypothetical protein BWY69_00654 [Planctomycetes bacterium ADurb.Bin401]|nr:MAG: hypothetical protein BWY69_00654 [Planctomycetes bacterium ADurb.Bin401]
MPDCQAIFFDCLIGFLGNIDNNSNSEVRQALTPLVELAEKRNVAIIGISHFNKKIDLDAKDRVIGSSAFAAVSRSVWAVILDKESLSDNPARLVLPVKANYSITPSGLRYTIMDGAVAFQAEAVQVNIDEVIGKKKTSRQAKAVDEAGAWIKSKLDGGIAIPSKEMLDEGIERGFSENALRKGLKKIGGRSWKPGWSDEWVWQLSTDGTEEDGE